jgi:hypothetical protein
VDERRNLLLDDGSQAGAVSGLKAGIQVSLSTLGFERLTAPGVVAEDTEKTVVFLYSKEKLCMWRAERRLG